MKALYALLGIIKYDETRQDSGCYASVRRSIHQVSFRRALAGSIAKEIPDLSSWTGRSGSSGRVVSPTACLALDWDVRQDGGVRLSWK